MQSSINRDSDEESKETLLVKGTTQQVKDLMKSTGKSRGDVIKALAQHQNPDRAFEALMDFGQTPVVQQ